MQYQKQLLTIKDIVVMSGYCRSTINRMKKDGRLPKPVTKPPQRPRWNAKVIADWVEGKV
jgi:predicted DNA-binding transcriptional regulator AlpA